MSAPFPNLSQRSKTVIAALGAAIITGVQAWQVATVGGFRLVDLLPVATAVAGALLTFAPNVPEWPWAKSGIHGVLAVLTALSTFVSSHSAGFTAVNLLTVASASFLVWFVPELAPLVKLTGSETLAALAAVPASPAAVQQLTQPIGVDGDPANFPGLLAPSAADTSLAELSSTAPLI